MRLDRVTITGADDSIDPHKLNTLTREFPFVEWGILVSQSGVGRSRFPSREWTALLLASVPADAKLSLHICGRWVRRLMVGGADFFEQWFPLDRHLDRFQRIQLNFHAQKHGVEIDDASEVIGHGFRGKEIILQMDGTENEALLAALASRGVACAPLFDVSGGAGIVPDSWPRPIPGFGYHGYAGGLGPETLERELPRIAAAAGPARAWIDMETRVRSGDDMRFDLGKVRRCLELAAPFVVRQ